MLLMMFISCILKVSWNVSVLKHLSVLFAWSLCHSCMYPVWYLLLLNFFGNEDFPLDNNVIMISCIFKYRELRYYLLK